MESLSIFVMFTLYVHVDNLQFCIALQNNRMNCRMHTMYTRLKCLQIENHDFYIPILATIIYYQVHIDEKGVTCWSQHKSVLPRKPSLTSTHGKERIETICCIYWSLNYIDEITKSAYRITTT